MLGSLGLHLISCALDKGAVSGHLRFFLVDVPNKSSILRVF